jgi:hypothetical protein
MRGTVIGRIADAIAGVLFTVLEALSLRFAKPHV